MSTNARMVRAAPASQIAAAAAAAFDGHLPAGINDIGVPGSPYFGLGICPALPAGFTALPLYGNYQFTDGSVMVWVPAFWYRIGDARNPTHARWLLNSIDVLPFSAFADAAAANAAGYALPRAFWNAGAVQPGFFVDKYLCSNNAGTASSIRLGNPLSTNGAHNPISALTGAPQNIFGGCFAAAKTRGARFFPAMRYMHVALAMLANAQAQAATSPFACAWWDGSATGLAGPKGCNNNALGDSNDNAISFLGDGFQSCSRTGSGVPFAKTTHNGQDNGIADLNGCMWEVSPGVTCVAVDRSVTGLTNANPGVLTINGHGGSTGNWLQLQSVAGATQGNDRLYQYTVVDANRVSIGVDTTGWGAYTNGGNARLGAFHAVRTDYDVALLTGGNSLATDAWGATGVAAHSQAVPYQSIQGGGFDLRYGNAANQVLSGAVAGSDWMRANLGIVASSASLSSSGISAFGQDFHYSHIVNELCPLAGGDWNTGSAAGVWAVAWGSARSYSHDPVGFRAASYL